MKDYLSFNLYIFSALFIKIILPVTILFLVIQFLLLRKHLVRLSFALNLISLAVPIIMGAVQLPAVLSIWQETGVYQPLYTLLSLLLIRWIPFFSSFLLKVILKRREKIETGRHG